MAETIKNTIKENGMTQGDLVRFMKNVRDVVNELQTDHATLKTMVDELHVDIDLNGAALAAILTKIDADAGITDTDYAAVHGRSGSGAGIQAAAVAATDVAALANSTALTLG